MRKILYSFFICSILISQTASSANDKISISLKSDYKNVSIRIINSIGQADLLTQFNTSISNICMMDVSELSSGIYSVEVSNDNEVLGIEKIVIQ